MTGQDIIVILSHNGTAIASTSIKSQDIKSHCDTIEKASSTQQSWVELLAGRKSWKIDISYLVLSAASVLDLLLVGETFTVTVKQKGSNTGVTGSAILTDVSNLASFGNLAQGSFTLQGSGALA